jgi:hypothetical protein
MFGIDDYWPDLSHPLSAIDSRRLCPLSLSTYSHEIVNGAGCHTNLALLGQDSSDLSVRSIPVTEL